MELTLKLTLDEVNAIVSILGEMPTKAGLYPLLMNIRAQAEPQLREPVPVETAHPETPTKGE
jgi:hypothetical protein